MLNSRRVRYKARNKKRAGYSICLIDDEGCRLEVQKRSKEWEHVMSRENPDDLPWSWKWSGDYTTDWAASVPCLK